MKQEKMNSAKSNKVGKRVIANAVHNSDQTDRMVQISEIAKTSQTPIS